MSNFFLKSKSFSPLKDGVQQVKRDHTVFNFQNEMPGCVCRIFLKKASRFLH